MSAPPATMPEYRDAVVISDLHLWDPAEPRYRQAVSFLEGLPQSLDLLVVLGDLFDFWIADNPILARRFEAVLGALGALRKRGVKILYCEGNHDLYLDRYFPRALDIETFVGERWVRVGGRTVHLSHGDLVNPHDRGYLFLRWLLRTPLVRALRALTPPRVHVAIGELSSRRSRAYTAGRNDPIRDLSHAYARSRIAAAADVVVIGHTHQPERVELTAAGGRHGVFLNTGLWLPDGTRWWARITADAVILHHDASHTLPPHS